VNANGRPAPSTTGESNADTDRVEAAIIGALGQAPSAEPGTVQAGLVGRGIQESRSPRMHEAEGRRLRLDYRYALLDFDHLHLKDGDLGEVVAVARRLGFAGFNVTHPFKQQVVPLLDSLGGDAAAIRSVNTVVLRPDGATGYNTDCWGFVESFRHTMADAPLGRVVLTGAGGAGMAVAHALAQLGADHIAIVDVATPRAEAVAESVNRATGKKLAMAAENLAEAAAKADGLVNATPVGMAKYPGSPVPPALLRPSLWVADIVYFPAETVLLRQARGAGCRVLAGAGMAIFQAARAFELITGLAADTEAMRSAFDDEEPGRRLT
jgi:shikimate dehydrogenase